MIGRKVYQCEFCPSATAPITKTSGSMRLHENNCHYSPKNKTCLTCGRGKPLTKKEEHDFFTDYDYFPETKKDIFGDFEDDLTYGNLLMVRNCQGWKAKN